MALVIFETAARQVGGGIDGVVVVAVVVESTAIIDRFVMGEHTGCASESASDVDGSTAKDFDE